VLANDVPILEFDPDPRAHVEPSHDGADGAPLAAVACFFPEIVSKWAARGKAILDLPGGECLLEIEHHGHRLAIFYPGIGAPLAACRLETVIAAGCRAIVGCGVGGALQPDLLSDNPVIVVKSAIRDEGTSYHYLAPAREVSAESRAVEVLMKAALERGLPCIGARTWTTDAYFRETAGRIARRRLRDGCLIVEMEAAALIAVARFRGVRFGQYLYPGDDLSGEVWDHRNWWDAPQREHLFALAAEAALALIANGEAAHYHPATQSALRIDNNARCRP
jgi:uridine phosphorylase